MKSKRYIPTVFLVFALMSGVWAQTDPNLVAYWNFDDETLTDLSGNGNNGSPASMVSYAVEPPFVYGDSGASLDLNYQNSDNQYAEIPDSPSLSSVVQELTIAAWVRIDEIQNWDGIVTKGNAQGAWALQLSASDTLKFTGNYGAGWDDVNGVFTQIAYLNLADMVGTGTVTSSLIVPDQNDTEWTMVAVTSDGAQVTFYVNDQSETHEQAFVFGQVEQPLFLGCDFPGGDEFYNGIMDEVRIFNRALSKSEVLYLVDHPQAFAPTPADGAFDVTHGQLQWYPATDASQQVVMAGTDPDQLTQVAELAGDAQTATLSDMAPETTYTWRVDAGDVTGVPWTFTTAQAVPHSPDPADGALQLNSTLTWRPALGANSYEVYLGEDPNQLASVATVPEPAFQPTGLADDTIYYWRVDAVTAESTVSSPVWSLTTLPPADANLAIYLSLDEGSGAEALDLSGKGNSGTIYGEPAWIEGPAGQALSLDGVDDYVAIPQVLTDTWSILYWVKTADTSAAGNWYQGKGLVNCERGGCKGDYGMSLANGNKVVAAYGGQASGCGTTNLVSSMEINDDIWHHVAWTFSENGKGELYIDGTLDASIDTEDINMKGDIAFVLIGVIGNTKNGEMNPAEGKYLIGAIDEVKIFNSVLTAAQINRQMLPDLSQPMNPAPTGDVDMDVTEVNLQWTPGEGAVSHNVYVGTNKYALELVSEAQDANSYTLADLTPGQTIFWQIGEVQADDSESKGQVWQFSVKDYIAVDTFETYTTDTAAEDNQVWLVWLSGFDGFNDTGSVVDYVTEEKAFNGSKQSMPFIFDNTGNFRNIDGVTNGALHSEIYREFTSNTDWTRSGVAALFLAWYGYKVDRIEDNGAELDLLPAATDKLYLGIEDADGTQAFVLWDGPAGDLLQEEWHAWHIDLVQLAADHPGLDLATVKRLILGVGDRDNPQAGGIGTLWVDEIRLHVPRPVPALAKSKADLDADGDVDADDLAVLSVHLGAGGPKVAPVDPGDSGRVVYFPFDGDLLDTKGNAASPTPQDNAGFGPGLEGQALALDGLGDYVDLGADFGANAIQPLTSFSSGVWVKAVPVGNWSFPRVWQFGNSGNNKYVALLPTSKDGSFGAQGGPRFELKDTDKPDGKGNNHTINAPNPGMRGDEWAQITTVLDADAKTLQIYVNGQLILVEADVQRNPNQNIDTFDLNVLGCSFKFNNNLLGSMDELCFYNRPLSHAEAAGLADLTEPVSTLLYGPEADSDLNDDGTVDVADQTLLEAAMGEVVLWP